MGGPPEGIGRPIPLVTLVLRPETSGQALGRRISPRRQSVVGLTRDTHVLPLRCIQSVEKQEIGAFRVLDTMKLGAGIEFLGF
jgi:hypothetical protein